MTTMTRRLTLLLPLGAAIGLAACQTTQSSASSSSGDMSSSDLEFVTNAFDIIAFDRAECTLAQTQARSPEVRSLAAKLLADANQFDAQLRPIAMQAGITPPTVLPATLRNRAGRLRLGQGAQFDRAFLADQIVSHQDALNLEDAVRTSQSSNPRVASLAQQGFSLVRANLDRLQALQAKLS